MATSSTVKGDSKERSQGSELVSGNSLSTLWLLPLSNASFEPKSMAVSGSNHRANPEKANAES